VSVRSAVSRVRRRREVRGFSAVARNPTCDTMEKGGSIEGHMTEGEPEKTEERRSGGL
jgi:hypothetical protein